MSARLLGIDLGTSAVKVLLTTLDGAVVASASAEYPIEQPQPDYAEQAPAAWLRAILARSVWLTVLSKYETRTASLPRGQARLLHQGQAILSSRPHRASAMVSRGATIGPERA